jgi:hypothetical protein
MSWELKNYQRFEHSIIFDELTIMFFLFKIKFKIPYRRYFCSRARLLCFLLSFCLLFSFALLLSHFSSYDISVIRFKTSRIWFHMGVIRFSSFCQYNYHNSEHYPTSCLSFKTQRRLNFVSAFRWNLLSWIQ